MSNNSIDKDLKTKYRRKDSLIRKKYWEYVPVLLITNLSTLLFTAVDGIVVGRYMGGLALAAVNLFNPVAVFLSAYIAVISHGIADSFADALVGNNSIESIYNSKAIKFVILYSVIVLSIIQGPIAHFIIHSYGLNTTLELNPILHDWTRTYAAKVLISMPFTLISTIGACQLQELGKMKVLMVFAIIEGLANLILDIVLVGVFRLGIYGAGLATVIAAIIRVTLTVIYFLTKTNIYKKYRVKVRTNDVKKIIVGGLSYSVSIISSAIHSYLMIQILLRIFAEDGAIIGGVCSFCLSVAMVFITSSVDANGPLNGIFLSIGDRVGQRNAFKISARQIIISVGVFVILIQKSPEFFYHLNGADPIHLNDFCLNALRLYSLSFVFYGLNILFNAYFVDEKKIRTAVRLTFWGDLLVPLVALIYYKMIGHKYIWLAEVTVSFMIFSIYLIRYVGINIKKYLNEEEKDTLYLEVKPRDAVKVSRELFEYSEERGYAKDLTNKVSLCMEEMVRYAVKSQDAINVSIQIIIRFYEYGAKFVMLDDGKCIYFNKSKEREEIITNNYELIRRISKSYKYKYLLNMNYTTIEL